MRSAGAAWVFHSLTFGALIFPSLVSAGLTVLYDSGDTRPLVPWLDVLAPAPPPVREPAPRPPLLGAADLETLLPIASPGLTPGKVDPRPVKRPFARPFFLIGADPWSRRWLETHRAELLRIGAIGMLVQAETADDLRVIAELAGGLPIIPAPATDIAEALGLSHYPVLVSSQGIAQ